VAVLRFIQIDIAVVCNDGRINKYEMSPIVFYVTVDKNVEDRWYISRFVHSHECGIDR
jgi:hypothetical protein